MTSDVDGGVNRGAGWPHARAGIACAVVGSGSVSWTTRASLLAVGLTSCLPAGDTNHDTPTGTSAASSSTASSSAPSVLDGVYLDVPAMLGGYEAIEIRGAEVWYDPHRPPEQPRFDPTFRWGPDPGKGALALDGARHELTLTLPDGRDVVASYAVVDGELWLGVLRREGLNRWRGRLFGADGHARLLPPPRLGGSIDWDRGAGTLALDLVSWSRQRGPMFPRPYRAETLPPMRLEHVMERHIDDVDGGTLLIPVFPEAEVAHDSPLEPIVGQRRRPWRQHGDVMLTPLSQSLGPVGMLPAAAPVRAIGSWTGPRLPSAPDIGRTPAPPSMTLSLVATAAELEPAYVIWPSSRGKPPGPHQLPHADHPHPNARGVSYSAYGHNCVMGHGDEPGALVWFPLADGRLFVHHRLASHGARSAARYLLSPVAPDGSALE
jgi:hypothetical protein